MVLGVADWAGFGLGFEAFVSSGLGLEGLGKFRD